ncbi:MULTISPECIES: bacteriohemerythrin [unclassified Oceanobacter]|uniref:bacteriohemerythrin n=1 Tax=unclassified Oceanobacter TaxID=2620260 RepID=UPI0026E1D791|nr:MULTISPECIES: bacteriohemerythrin [unclassified Oceanobacter]MDO6683241.1 bacteriohemerythrin [Oceanobacter sp. 5_MG-2023]MDP2504194.1 bacteriohemerythrin [Oceanobacter sp. 3_MG-2023]MDP2546632.1 bacteriohemerythrin [Oceanobacter sp. 4_MG-2023]MDP2608626.1 bacteriohemerythrin [Oceanobacter sp. 1_MG-2023]MDP2611612.1 bacteriohemerythrin [Oceanobacter sp. 2_MG-2023]
MSYFVWNASYDIGVDIIDSQHRRIADYVNDLHHAIEHNDVSEVYSVMDRLKDYTVDHFSFEEQLMARAGYPLLDDHLLIHEKFCEHMELLREQLHGGTDPMNVARKMRTGLMRWLLQHIKEEDQNYASLVRKALRKESSWVSATLKRVFGSVDHHA